MPNTNFHAEFTSADASALSEANARMTVYGEGTTVAATLGAADSFVLTDISVRVGASGLTVSIFDGADATVDNGERVFVGTFAANTGDSPRINTPFVCQVGTYPKVKTSGAGQVDVYARGYVRRG